jgi:hypothetical protein
MQPIASIHPSLTSSSRDLHDEATCTTRCRSSTSFEANWETLAQLASRQSKLTCVSRHPPPVGFVAQPRNHRQHGFEAQTKKPSR